MHFNSFGQNGTNSSTDKLFLSIEENLALDSNMILIKNKPKASKFIKASQPKVDNRVTSAKIN